MRPRRQLPQFLGEQRHRRPPREFHLPHSLWVKSGKVLARFDSPSGHGIWVDSTGSIYLAEAGKQRLTNYIRQR